MSDVTLARRIVAAMMKKDAFSQWLGIEVLEVDVRRVAVRMTVREEMLNGFGVCHGGVTFALADTALACACNSTKHVAMSIENTIRYPTPVQSGDVLTAVANPQTGSSRLGFYEVVVANQHGATVALFTGTTYTTTKTHDSATSP